MNREGHSVHTSFSISVISIISIYISYEYKIQYASIRQEHNIMYNHMNENNIRLETSTNEQKEPLS